MEQTKSKPAMYVFYTAGHLNVSVIDETHSFGFKLFNEINE